MPLAGCAASPTLTIGMAVYDDYDGVYFTVTALGLYHPAVAGRVRLLVVDNRPDGPDAPASRALAGSVPDLRYLRAAYPRGTAVRDLVFRAAQTDWVMCIDAHVMLAPGALARLLDFMDAHPDCADLLQGPYLDSDLRWIATHWEPGWRDGVFGMSGVCPDPRGLDRDGEPFEIGMQSLGLFACRRDAWLGFNPRFRGLGGEEGYLHEKYRAAGQRTLCLPFLGWTHRFRARRPSPEPTQAWERVRNYLIGREELGMPTEPVFAHLEQTCGQAVLEDFLERWEAEKSDPFSFFDAIYCINLDTRPDRWERMRGRLDALGIAEAVRRFPAVLTPDKAVGSALSHRGILEQARTQGLEHVLVLEDNAVFLAGTAAVLGPALQQLADLQWNACYLGGGWYRTQPSWRFRFPPVSAHLEYVHGLTTTHAIAYHHRSYDQLLAGLPGEESEMREWIAEHKALGQYYAETLGAGIFRTVPVLASQENLVSYEDPGLRNQFVLTPPSRPPQRRRPALRQQAEHRDPADSGQPGRAAQTGPAADGTGQLRLPATLGIVLPWWKVLYVITPKAACTSLMWMCASLQEEDLEAFRTSLEPQVTRAALVHDFSMWRGTRWFQQLSQAERRQITDDGDWLIFCVTRHPVTRLWSAWQSKLLMREPDFVRRYGSGPWFPRVPHGLTDVAADFRSFVDALRHEPGLIEGNQHWRPQADLLRTESFPYSHIGKVEKLGITLDLLEEHLRRQGWEGTLAITRENQTPLPFSVAALDPETIETVERIYAQDLELFGYPSIAASLSREQRPDETTNQMMHAVRLIIERNERIGDMWEAITGTTGGGPAR